mmetsp:Transcript_38409/g.84227  ORF Transcript_38409/g.84227 Transcript_38409/m.84227 type:complete len:221 (+) Transcript_38409:164-826(+)
MLCERRASSGLAVAQGLQVRKAVVCCLSPRRDESVGPEHLIVSKHPNSLLSGTTRPLIRTQPSRTAVWNTWGRSAAGIQLPDQLTEGVLSAFICDHPAIYLIFRAALPVAEGISMVLDHGRNVERLCFCAVNPCTAFVFACFQLTITICLVTVDEAQICVEHELVFLIQLVVEDITANPLVLRMAVSCCLQLCGAVVHIELSAPSAKEHVRVVAVAKAAT